MHLAGTGSQEQPRRETQGARCRRSRDGGHGCNPFVVASRQPAVGSEDRTKPAFECLDFLGSGLSTREASAYCLLLNVSPSDLINPLIALNSGRSDRSVHSNSTDS